ncbi:MAG: 3-phosphoshikimate 1-carboxyvinyltransferase [Oscillospiraceae bacterium]|nr:3-phosphoshikimate 1-carboxyvinyltransferase [Oscillospiraceae bacterium]
MDIRITPAVLKGSVEAVSSKSAAHRIMIMAALCSTPTHLLLNSKNDDMTATGRCLAALGCGVEETGDGFLLTPGAAADKLPLLDCGESGSTLRFLLPVAAALGCGGRFEGHGRLPQRTIAALVKELNRHGCTTDRPDGLPITINGKLTGGKFVLPGDVSSQFITGLLMALPLLKGNSQIRLTTPLQSSAYVDLTIHLMKRFGVTIDIVENGWNIGGGQTYRSPGTLAAEGDWSGAAFWLAAGALGGDILSTGLELDSTQGDKAFVDMLNQMGAPCRVEETGIRSCGRICQPIEADILQVPDLAPMLALLCAAGGQKLYMTGGARLRDKESDRLSACADAITALGGCVEETADSLLVHPGSLRGGECDSFGDHRMAMALAIAACGCSGPVVIRNAQAVSKSYPLFWEEYRRLGGKIDVL